LKEQKPKKNEAKGKTEGEKWKREKEKGTNGRNKRAGLHLNKHLRRQPTEVSEENVRLEKVGTLKSHLSVAHRGGKAMRQTSQRGQTL
jgi:hypothetical protein